MDRSLDKNKELVIRRKKDRRNMMWRMEEETAGNKRTQAGSGLEIGDPNDAYEQEADAVANTVVNGGNVSIRSGSSPALNRSHLEKDEDENKLMAKSENGNLQGTDQLETKLNSSKGGGSPLDKGIKTEMEDKMGANLSGVKIHTDSNAHEMSAGISAKAFTHGQDIYFKQGNFDTNSNEGKKLLAHELTHTVQQRGSVSRTLQRELDPDFDDEKATRLILRNLSKRTREKVLTYFKVKSIPQIMAFWGFRLEHRINDFINAVKLREYEHYPREIGATLLVIPESVRLNWLLDLLKNDYDVKNKLQTGLGIKAALLMQGFSTASLRTIKEAEKGTLYTRLNDLITNRGIMDIIQSAVAGFEARNKQWQKEGFSTDAEKWKDYVSGTAKADSVAKQMEDSMDDTGNGTGAYEIFEALSEKDQQMLLERHPDTYSRMESSLPAGFRRSEDFGFAKGKDESAEKKKQDTLQQLLKNKVFLQYRTLYQDPQHFSELYEFAGVFKQTFLLSGDSDEAGKNQERYDALHKSLTQYYGISNPHAYNMVMPHYTLLYDEVTDEGTATDLIKERAPKIKEDESYRSEEIIKYIPKFIDASLNSFITEFPDLFKASLASSDKGLESDFMATGGSESDVLLSKVINNSSYSKIYFEANGLAKALETENTYADSNLLELILRMVIQSGFQTEAQLIIKAHFYDKGLKDKYPDAYGVLQQKGFLESEYKAPPNTLTSNTAVTEPQMSGWEKLWWLVTKKSKVAESLNGLFTDQIKVTNLSLVKTQEILGGHTQGIEFIDAPIEKPTADAISNDTELSELFTSDSSKKSGVISAEVNEKDQFTTFQAYYLPFKSMNVIFPDKTFKSDGGYIAGVNGKFTWPGSKQNERGETMLNVKEFSASNITFTMTDSVYGIGKIAVKDIAINLNQAIGTKAQLRQMSNIATQVMNILYNMSMLIVNAGLTMMDAYSGFTKDDPGKPKGVYQPLVDLKNALNIEFDEKFVLDFAFGGLEMSNIVSSSSGKVLDNFKAGYNRLFIASPQAFYEYLLDRLNKNKEKNYFAEDIQSVMEPEVLTQMVIEFIKTDEEWMDIAREVQIRKIEAKENRELSDKEKEDLELSDTDIKTIATELTPVFYQKSILKKTKAELEKRIEIRKSNMEKIVQMAKQWKTMPAETTEQKTKKDELNLAVKSYIYDLEGAGVSIGMMSDTDFEMDGNPTMSKQEKEESKGFYTLFPPILPLAMLNPDPDYWNTPLTDREMDEIINYDLSKLYSLSNLLAPKN